MRTNTLLLSCSVGAALMLCNAIPVSATPGSGSNLGIEHFDTVADLSRWSLGFYGLGRERKSGPNDIKHQKYSMYVGHDALRWVTPYITLGQSKTKIGIEEYGGWEPEYGLGVNVNLLDHVIPDPLLMEDRVRVNAGCEYTLTETERVNDDTDWGEVYAHLTVGLVNDIVGSKIYLPESICLYGGVIASIVHGDSLLDDGDEYGATVGVDIFFTETVALEFAIEYLDEADFAGGVHIRF